MPFRVQFINEFSPAPMNNRFNRREKAQARKEEGGAAACAVEVGPAFEPSYVYKMLHALRNETSFQVAGRQEDAEEFLSLLLNSLHEEMSEVNRLYSKYCVLQWEF